MYKKPLYRRLYGFLISIMRGVRLSAKSNSSFSSTYEMEALRVAKGAGIAYEYLSERAFASAIRQAFDMAFGARHTRARAVPLDNGGSTTNNLASSARAVTKPRCGSLLVVVFSCDVGGESDQTASRQRSNLGSAGR